ncbi:MDC1 protein, partial [Trogon melanurus]|nr:MDC1 protein [Trogon melanurus]
QEEEKELPEAAGPRLRPRGGAGSAPPKVLFTGVVASPAMEVALRSLGGSMAASVFDCTHLVTDRVRRTVKFLCAVARGVPIVTPEWLHKVPRGLGTGEGVLGDREVLGDIVGSRQLWGRRRGCQGTTKGSLGTGSAWGQRRGPWGQESGLGNSGGWPLG